MEFLIVLLPYLLSILLKLTSIFLDRKLILEALERLAAIAKPPGESFDLTSDRRELIADYVFHASIKPTTALTGLTSFVTAVIVILSEGRQQDWIAWVLPAILTIIFVSFWIVLPAKVYTFERRWLRVDLAVWIVLLFCLYDILLAVVSVLALRAPF